MWCKCINNHFMDVSSHFEKGDKCISPNCDLYLALIKNLKECTTMAATMELILKHNFEIQITDKSLPKCHQTCNFPLHDIYTISNVHMSVLNNNGIYI